MRAQLPGQAYRSAASIHRYKTVRARPLPQQGYEFAILAQRVRHLSTKTQMEKRFGEILAWLFGGLGNRDGLKESDIGVLWSIYYLEVLCSC